MGGRWWRVALAALVVGMFAGAAHAQTVADGSRTALTGGKIAGVNRTDSTGVVYGEGAVPGTLPVDDVLRDRDWSIYYSDIINNFGAKTAPGGADSSAAFDIGGATKLSIRLYPIISDSTGAVRYQVLYVQARYGRGATTDSTGAFPHVAVEGGHRTTVLDSLGATVNFLPIYADGATALNWIVFSQPGEIAVLCPPYDKIGHDYVTFNLPDPPGGSTYCSVRVRVGYVQMASTLRGATTNAIDTKWTAGYRVDLLGGR